MATCGQEGVVVPAAYLAGCLGVMDLGAHGHQIGEQLVDDLAGLVALQGAKLAMGADDERGDLIRGRCPFWYPWYPWRRHSRVRVGSRGGQRHVGTEMWWLQVEGEERHLDEGLRGWWELDLFVRVCKEVGEDS